jgi:hypothetical protein
MDDPQSRLPLRPAPATSAGDPAHSRPAAPLPLPGAVDNGRLPEIAAPFGLDRFTVIEASVRTPEEERA